jgi:phosphopantothenoylcysteine decarboxylase/phosphopantothenate--cysteine ligase
MGSIVVGVSGGIAAYKTVEVVRQLAKLGYNVKVVMTEHATRMVGPATFRAISGNAVALSLFEESNIPMWHISLAREADLVIVAPATANILAKMAHGLADDLLSTTLLATRAPVLVAPAMNSNMYGHHATQDNLAKLVEMGIQVIGPDYGSLACEGEGEGRMAEPARIVETALGILGMSKLLDGLEVLVTAGGTREPIDPVRFIGNRSSGKMGYALAEIAVHMGAGVTLISGPTQLREPPGVETVHVNTADEMRHEVVRRAPGCSIVVMAAAVADFTPRRRSGDKIKKENRDSLTLELVPTTDILKELCAKRKKGQVIVGFAAETGELHSNARAKLKGKKVDMLVANDVSEKDTGFDSDFNRALILYADGREIELDTMPKKDLALRIWIASVELIKGTA